VEVKTVE
jgi:transcriptional regulator with XRE-family HTH domain